MNNQQWDEFFDKLDFVQLSGRWELLPLHWLDSEFPESAQELERDLVSGLLEVREMEASVERKEKAKLLVQEYRHRLGGRSVGLDPKLCPPGSRVTLKYLNPDNLGEGDCLITTGAWDQVGYLVAELAKPGGRHLESVGEEPVRQEPGELNFRHIVLFPDRGAASPRAFRALCEKALRQARSYGGKHFVLTHLHLPQSGLADSFAAAEVVSAVRQLLREGPGTTVDILVFSHRNFADYRHWFESMSGLSGSTPKETGYELPPSTPDPSEAGDEEVSEVVGTLKSLAKRSSAMAGVASASVSRWLKGQNEEAPTGFPWRELSFEEEQQLAHCYLLRAGSQDAELQNGDRDPVALYLWALNRVIFLEQNPTPADPIHLELLEGVREWARLAEHHPWWRYFGLLERRLSKVLEQPPTISEMRLVESAAAWDDRALLHYLSPIEEETQKSGTKPRLAPVSPGGSRNHTA